MRLTVTTLATTLRYPEAVRERLRQRNVARREYKNGWQRRKRAGVAA